jgi:cellulose biosynthesis protein BcsQ
VTGTTTALVGATGGAGTTRLCVEFAVALAGPDRPVCVLDAAYGTQGLTQYVDERVDPDVTRCCTDGEPLERALVEPSWGEEVWLAPAMAPFERLARAKRPEAARRFEELLGTAADRFEHVLVDTPPVAANQSVAAATAADRRVLVTPGTRRGADALPRMAGRLRDVGAPADAELANRSPGGVVDRADAAVEEGPVGVVRPAVLDEGPFAASVAGAIEATLTVDPAVEYERGRLDRLLG